MSGCRTSTSTSPTRDGRTDAPYQVADPYLPNPEYAPIAELEETR
jgi:hypothetical protein